jgi:hypothetical protein
VLVDGAAGVDGFSEATDPGPRVSSAVAEKVATSSTRPALPAALHGARAGRARDGRVFEETQDAPRGGPEHPLPLEELRAKFRANALRALPAAQADLLLEQLLAIEGVEDVAPVVARLRRAA